MNPAESGTVYSRLRHIRCFCLAAVFAGLLLAVRGLPAQSSTSSADSGGFRKPIAIGTMGLVQVGDNPAYASTDLDDSRWIAVDDKKLFREYFPQNRQPILWHRMHLRVNPADSGLALSIEPFGIDRAFEIYVNGRLLLQSGRVVPYAPYTRSGRLLVPIPDELTHTGALTIAIRASVPLATWVRANPAFHSMALILGSEAELRDRIVLRMVNDKAMGTFLALLGLGVGLVALVLSTSQTRRMEYFCIFVLGLTGAVRMAFYIYLTVWNVPAIWNVLEKALDIVNCIVFLLLCQALTRERFNRWLWVYVVAAEALVTVVTLLFDRGTLPGTYTDLANAPSYFIFTLIVPVLLFRKFRRGNREAGLMIFFLVFWSVAMYAVILLSIFNLFSIFKDQTEQISQWIFGFQLGPMAISAFDLGSLFFWVSLALIMVLRATQSSRVQATLEGEMAAARAVQHVILADEVESVPGFHVESVYLSAQEVGGDFFQILQASDGGMLLIVGDVAGKGLPAAMLVSVLVGLIRGIAEYTESPDTLLTQLNEQLVGRARGGFSTTIAAHIASDGLVTIANAGHLSPYLDGQEIELPPALPLGVVNGANYETSRFHLAPGSRLTFYSDGVIEAQNEAGELFGFKRGQAISTQPAAAIVEAPKIFGQSDDITVVAITRNAAAVAAA